MSEFKQKVKQLFQQHEALISQKNHKKLSGNGIYDRRTLRVFQHRRDKTAIDLDAIER